MNKRISQIRKEAGKTQDEFAEILGLSKNFISLIENGKREPSDRTIKDICRELSINEQWLRTGEGEKDLALSREEELAKITKDWLLNDTEYKNRLISALAKLDENQLELLANIADTMVKQENAKKE